MSLIKRVSEIKENGNRCCHFCKNLKNGRCSKLNMPVYLDNYCCSYTE